ncbi:MAG: hypothetical protein RLZZ414_1069 [Bacteroidota bacterium]|jgi:hypothetical protein
MTKKEKHLHFTINRKIAVDCKHKFWRLAMLTNFDLIVFHQLIFKK